MRSTSSEQHMPVRPTEALSQQAPLTQIEIISRLIEQAESLGLEVTLREAPARSGQENASDGHRERCLEMAAKLTSSRDIAADREILDWFRNRRTTARCLLEPLGLRERQVVLLVAHGYSNKQTAGVLEISEKTIEKYRSSACRKLQVQSSAELALLISAADAFVDRNLRTRSPWN